MCRQGKASLLQRGNKRETHVGLLLLRGRLLDDQALARLWRHHLGRCATREKVGMLLITAFLTAA